MSATPMCCDDDATDFAAAGSTCPMEIKTQDDNDDGGSSSSGGNDKDSAETDGAGSVHGLRLVRATHGVDARISLWTCFHRFVIGLHHADMAKYDFRTKSEFAKWAKSANLSFHLPRGYSLSGSPRKYYLALAEFWRWYQVLFSSSSCVAVVEEKQGFGLAVRKACKASRGGSSFLREEGLSGELFELQEKDYDALRDAGYPSLFFAQGKYYILAGPLSLINERCSLAKTYLQWGCNVDRSEVWLKPRDRGHLFAAGERLWTRYEFGKLSVAKDQCFCPDNELHKQCKA
jgi:hypothetical protein